MATNGQRAVRRMLNDALSLVMDVRALTKDGAQYGKPVKLSKRDTDLLFMIRFATDKGTLSWPNRTFMRMVKRVIADK